MDSVRFRAVGVRVSAALEAKTILLGRRGLHRCRDKPLPAKGAAAVGHQGLGARSWRRRGASSFGVELSVDEEVGVRRTTSRSCAWTSLADAHLQRDL